ncbi:MAG: hypothetical protein HY078_12600 [Elusimicrobia bacterium]|nr:hypothetical protein [Elusimicrobiota bacterium]
MLHSPHSKEPRKVEAFSTFRHTGKPLIVMIVAMWRPSVCTSSAVGLRSEALSRPAKATAAASTQKATGPERFMVCNPPPVGG